VCDTTGAMSSGTREPVPSSVPRIFSKVEEAKVGSYERYFVDAQEKKAREDRAAEGERREAYEDVTNQYYDLATQFYEYGWGQSFHFAPMHADETLRESLRRHEHYLALRMGLTKQDRVLDVGCGIGGPLREMAHFAGSSITGINNNQGQVERAQAINKQHGVKARLVKGDFMAMPFADGEFDAAYAIDATCHAPDLVGVYKEVFRVLKPGGYFAGYEWCMTAGFDRNNPEHLRIKREIEFGNGIADLKTTEQCKDALREAGYEIIEIEDRHDGSATPWYEPMAPSSSVSLTAFRCSYLGRFLTRNMLWLLESVRLVPPGTCRVQKFLELAADSLAEGGKTGTFTPLYFFLVKKPAQ